MANETMSLISTVTVGAGGASAMTFSAIPQNYTDLFLIHSTRKNDTSGSAIRLNLNSSTANFTYRMLTGDGASAASFNGTTSIAGYANFSNYTADTFATGTVYLPNYTESVNKSFSVESAMETNSSSGPNIFALTGLWSSTAAITELSLTLTSSTFAQYSSASLYGILKGSGGATVS